MASQFSAKWLKQRMERIGKYGETTAKRLVSEKSAPPPSDPGEPPALDSGLLYRTIDHQTYAGKTVVSTVIRSTAHRRGRPYPYFLSTGTPKMEPRPWLVPTLEIMRKYMSQRLGEKLSSREVTEIKHSWVKMRRERGPGTTKGVMKVQVQL